MRKQTRKRNWLLPVLAAMLVLLLLVEAVLIFTHRTPTVPTETLQTVSTETAVASTEQPIPTSAPSLSPEKQIYQNYLSSVDPGEAAYQDMDGDGTDELLIKRHGTWDIVVIRDGQAVSLSAETQYGAYFFRCEDNVIGQFSEGSGGCTYWFYQVQDHQLKNLDCLVFLWDKGVWYRSPDFSGNWDTMVSITEEERLAVGELYSPLDSDAEFYMAELLRK